MSNYTENLGLFKYDKETDQNEVFDVDKALNENWDKIDNEIKELKNSSNASIDIPNIEKYRTININGELKMYQSPSPSNYFNSAYGIVMLSKIGKCASFVEIPETFDGITITTLTQSWFSERTNLIYVSIPDTVTIIGEKTFYKCTSLSLVKIGNSVTKIRNSAFSGCYSLISINIPDSVTEIEGSAFYNCAFESITIPESVITIGNGAFQSCDNLNTIYYKGSEEQWNAINIGSDNTYLTNATKVYNYTE